MQTNVAIWLLLMMIVCPPLGLAWNMYGSDKKQTHAKMWAITVISVLFFLNYGSFLQKYG